MCAIAETGPHRPSLSLSLSLANKSPTTNSFLPWITSAHKVFLSIFTRCPFRSLEIVKTVPSFRHAFATHVTRFSVAGSAKKREAVQVTQVLTAAKLSPKSVQQTNNANDGT